MLQGSYAIPNPPPPNPPAELMRLSDATGSKFNDKTISTTWLDILDHCTFAIEMKITSKDIKFWKKQKKKHLITANWNFFITTNKNVWSNEIQIENNYKTF